uniref:Replication factor C 40 kDa, putative n=1 Tax=Arundo donax TaxID=35708 RepID=A0A0A9F4Z2_ARUDO
MRQALNDLQGAFSGFCFVNQENMFKVHPQLHHMQCLFG